MSLTLKTIKLFYTQNFMFTILILHHTTKISLFTYLICDFKNFKYLISLRTKVSKNTIQLYDTTTVHRTCSLFYSVMCIKNRAHILQHMLCTVIEGGNFDKKKIFPNDFSKTYPSILKRCKFPAQTNPYLNVTTGNLPYLGIQDSWFLTFLAS